MQNKNTQNFFSRNLRKIFLIFSLTVVVGVISITLYLFFLQSFIDNKFIQYQFKKMPNVEFIAINSYDGHVNPAVNIKGKGIIRFVDTRTEDFSRTSNLYIDRIGPWEIHGSCQKDDKYFEGTSFNLAENQNASHFFSFKMHTISDVINHYDEILKVVQNWPSLNKVSQKGLECSYNKEKSNTPN